jgi:acyl-homoserine-lactone acylase
MSKDVEIVRDSYGVPTVFSTTDAGAGYGLAWAHSEDDFATIQEALSTAKGLGGLNGGSNGLIGDYFVAALDMRALVERDGKKHIGNAGWAVLSAYADGINAYAASHPDRITQPRLFPVTPEDVATHFAVFMALLSGIGDQMGALIQGPSGSNAFAVSPKATGDGSTVVLINPHNPVNPSPITWYEAGVQSREGWVAHGGLFPGTATLALGVTPTTAWGHTLNFPRRTDLYRLVVRDGRYLLDGRWREFREKRIWLKLGLFGGRFVVPIPRTLRWSVHGPVVTGKDGRTYALRAPALRDAGGPGQWLTMNKARDFEAFRGAVSGNHAAGFDIVYGDKAGRIWWIANGAIPVRSNGSSPLPGARSDAITDELRPTSALPQRLNPPDGFLWSVNNAPRLLTAVSDRDFPDDTGVNRPARIAELRRRGGALDYAALLQMRDDVCLPKGFKFRNGLHDLVRLERVPDDIVDLTRVLRQWNGCADSDSVGATLFAGVMALHPPTVVPPDIPMAVLDREAQIKALREVRDRLVRRHGTWRVPLGLAQQLQRGKTSVPAEGLYDTLSAVASKWTKDDRLIVDQGDSLVLAVRWDAQGKQTIEARNIFGASADPNSPHFADQINLRREGRYRPVSLVPADITRAAARRYHPGTR